MLLDGTATFQAAHDEKRMRDPKVLEVRRRVELYGDDELQRAMPSRQGIVELTLRDGRALRHHTKAVRGTHENPMTREEVDEKCLPLLRRRARQEARARLDRRCLAHRAGRATCARCARCSGRDPSPEPRRNS